MAEQSEFLRLSSSLTQKVNKIRSNTDQIKNLAAQMGTPRDSEELRGKLHSKQNETKQAVTDAASMLRRVESMTNPADRGQRTQVDRLQDDVIRSTNAFQAAQRDLIARERESLARARSATATTGPAALVDFGQDSDLGLGPGSPSGFGRMPTDGEQRVSQMEMNADTQAIEQREAEMLQLEQDILQVNDVFRDLGRLVHEQGEMVDSIAYNVESAHVAVESGNQNLQKAVKSKRSARRKKIICGVVIFVVLGVIIALIAIFARPKS